MIQFTRFPPEVQPMTHLHPMMDNMFKWKMKHLVMFQRLSSDLLTQQTTKKSLQLLLLLIPIKFRTLINNNKINTKIKLLCQWDEKRVRVKLE